MKRSERVIIVSTLIFFIALLSISITIRVKYNGLRFRIDSEDIHNIKNNTDSTTESHLCNCNGTIMAEFTGKWKLDSSDNFDNFLKELGVNFMLRKMANSTSPTVEITRDGDAFEFKTTTAIKTSVTKFKLDEEFDEERLDGKKVKSVIVLDGNKLIQTQKDNGKDVTYVREINGDVMTVTSEANKVKCVRIYKRVA